jgi:hypothetical protein
MMFNNHTHVSKKASVCKTILETKKYPTLFSVFDVLMGVSVTHSFVSRSEDSNELI